MEFSARPPLLSGLLDLVLCERLLLEPLACGEGGPGGGCVFVCVCVCVCVVCYPAERMNDVTDPCSTVGPVDVSWQAEKKGCVHCPALWLHYTVIDHAGHHPGLRYTTSCTYLFIAADNGELTLKEYDPLMGW